MAWMEREVKALTCCLICSENPIYCKCGANSQWDWFWKDDEENED